MQEFKSIVGRGIFTNKRELIINKDLVRLETKNESKNAFRMFHKNEITDYRFGIRWYSYFFTFGREYIIEIKNINEKTIKINFKTYFGRKIKQYHELYYEIIDALWDYHFRDIANSYLLLQNESIDFEIAGIRFDSKGIYLKKTFIEWEDVKTKNYQTYFAIYSKNNPLKINMTYNYLEDWNVAVLYSVIRTILRKKGVEIYS